MTMAPRVKALVLHTSPFALLSCGLLAFASLATTGDDGLDLLWKAAVCGVFGAFTARCVVLRTTISRLRAEVVVAKKTARSAAVEAREAKAIARAAEAEVAALRAEIHKRVDELTRETAEELTRMRKAQAKAMIDDVTALLGGDGAAIPMPRPDLHIVKPPPMHLVDTED